MLNGQQEGFEADAQVGAGLEAVEQGQLVDEHRIAAGMLDNIALEQDGRRVLVKGRTIKELVPVDTGDDDLEVEREVLRSSVVVLDLDTGAIEVVERGGRHHVRAVNRAVERLVATTIYLVGCALT